jgi:hypothetical protein
MTVKKKEIPMYQYNGDAKMSLVGFYLIEASKYPTRLEQILPAGEYHVEIKVFRGRRQRRKGGE